MELREAKMELDHLYNERDLWLYRKEIEWTKTQPHSTDSTKERVDTSITRVDKYADYAFESKEIDKEIAKIDKKIAPLEIFIGEELAVLGEYGENKELVIQLREIKNLQWKEIAKKTYFSERQCKRIYRLYKMKRNI